MQRGQWQRQDLTTWVEKVLAVHDVSLVSVFYRVEDFRTLTGRT